MIDVAEAIDEEAVFVTLTTTATGGYNGDGDYVPGGPIPPYQIAAAIQPAGGNALKDMPEGIRTEADWLAWSRSEIKVDDVIASLGVDYRVLFVWPRAHDGVFWRAALARQK